MKIHSSQASGLRHAKSGIDLIALCQEIFPFDKETGVTAEFKAAPDILEYKIFLLFLVDGGVGIETSDILYAGSCSPSAFGEVQSGKHFVFGGCRNRIFHVQPTVIGIHIPMVTESNPDKGFQTPVFDFSGIDVFPDRAVGDDDVVAFQVKQVCSVRYGIV